MTTIDCPFCDQPVELDLATAVDRLRDVPDPRRARARSIAARGRRGVTCGRSGLPVAYDAVDGSIDRRRSHRSRGCPTRAARPDRRGRGQPVVPPRRRLVPRHAIGLPQGRAHRGRPGRRGSAGVVAATAGRTQRPTSRSTWRCTRHGPMSVPWHAHLPASMGLTLAGAAGRQRAPETAPCSAPSRSCRSARWAASSLAAGSPPPCRGTGPAPVAVILERHGAVAVGEEPDTAVDRLELVEVLCRAWRDALLVRAARGNPG